ncbi:MAG: hypothetical protein TREMPRED_003966 [Tremellales sp. Tagirdzhanova-0007]|nr:MAG: hypothetical protein TREMPRED_003966 [Tremellales sp. Tagirdzhanova-0007]
MQTGPRYYPNDGTLLSFDPDLEIPSHLSLLVTKYPPETTTFTSENGVAVTKDFYGLVSGPISIAYGLFILSISESPHAKIAIQGKAPLAWAKLYLAVAEEIASSSPQAPVSSVQCGIISHQVCLSAVSAIITQHAKHVHDLISYIPTVLTDPMDKQPEDEWVVGRAGFLYLLRLVTLHCPFAAQLIPPSTMTDIITAMLKRSPGTDQPWRFVGRMYLSMTHGWTGHITQILLSDPSYAQQVRPWIARIIANQLPNGNWNVFMDEPECEAYQKSDSVQITHGSPGIVVALFAIRPIYQHAGDDEMCERIDAAIAKAQDIIWEQGLLTKESCLLHGAAGNSLALLDLKRKATFLAKSTSDATKAGLADGTLEASSSPSGLFRGLMGTIWAMCEYQKGRSGVMPTFNDA